MTYASEIGIPGLYLCGAACMGMMVFLMYTYVERFGSGPAHEYNSDSGDAGTDAGTETSTKGKAKAGMLEGLYLFWRYRYVQVRD